MRTTISINVSLSVAQISTCVTELSVCVSPSCTICFHAHAIKQQFSECINMCVDPNRLTTSSASHHYCCQSCCCGAEDVHAVVSLARTHKVHIFIYIITTDCCVLIGEREVAWRKNTARGTGRVSPCESLLVRAALHNLLRCRAWNTIRQHSGINAVVAVCRQRWCFRELNLTNIEH